MSIRIEDLLDREKFKEEMIQLRRVFHQFRGCLNMSRNCRKDMQVS